MEGKLNIHQMIPDTRQSKRIGDQVVNKMKETYKTTSKKRSIGGTNLNDHNYFAALNNDDIGSLVGDMGININHNDFNKIDLMKDLEIARHALNSVEE